MAETPHIAVAAVVGCGVIGAGWAARLRLRGVDVRAYDPAPVAAQVMAEVHDNALRAWKLLDLEPNPAAIGSLVMCSAIAEACDGAEFVVESVPERLDLKHGTLREIDRTTDVAALIASSTSGLKPSVLAAPLRHPERFVVGHPFNPVYLLPLVEVVAGTDTSGATVERVIELYTALGMHPLRVRVEIDAHIADRLLEAVWREAQMGLFETYRIAGGLGGMRHFIAQFGECLSWPWTKLTDTPELTDELIETIAAQSDAQSGTHDVRELERIRDTNVAAILLALEQNQWGAGRTIAALRA
jgi:carnitine 3-dehydrogenase